MQPVEKRYAILTSVKVTVRQGCERINTIESISDCHFFITSTYEGTIRVNSNVDAYL